MRFPASVARLGGFAFQFLFVIIISGINFLPASVLQEQKPISLDRFDMLTADSGWVLLDQQLFWTSDAGQTWKQVGPSVPSGGVVRDVEFLEPDTGWILWTTANADGSSAFQLSSTTDHGRTWTTRVLSLFEPGETASYAEKAQMSWFDAQRGWISVKQESGSNFSLGTLFQTSDGGNNWERSALPVADEIHFSDPQTGWASGGPAGDQLFRTRDGGATWTDIRPAGIPANARTRIFPPDAGSLLATTSLGEKNSLNVYSRAASGEWMPAGEIPLNTQPGMIAFSILDGGNFLAAIPGTNSLVRMVNGDLQVLQNRDGSSASIVELDMISLDAGWAKWIDSSCSPVTAKDQTNIESCTTTTRLLQTLDGGLTWTAVQFPLVQADAILAQSVGAETQPPGASSLAGPGNTNLFVGHGFDTCEIPSLSQMQTWWDASPYKTVNLYIGGSSRACDNLVLSPSFLAQLTQQGWQFIPTWVGPQAPCTGFASRMSSDPSTAYTQGVNQANRAADRLTALGLTFPDGTGSVVYYDIEHYGTDAACRNAVKSFMNGWVSQIRARGSLAGVYGSTLCNTGLSDFRSIANVPDVIWPARWYHNPGSGSYDPTATVWDLGSCVPNTVWSNHQRIRQYEGGHQETWGDLTLEIDNDVLDGVVAVPYIAPVEVEVAGTVLGTYDLVFHESDRRSYDGLNNGPVKITNPDYNIIASQRVIYGGISYSEMMGMPVGQLSKEYLFPYYNNTAMDSQLRVSNLGNVSTTIKVSLAGQEIDSFELPAGEAWRNNYPGMNSGPLKVTSSSTDILTTIRVLYSKRSYSELMGYPVEQLSQEYWYPVYDNFNVNSQLRVSNVGSGPTIINVYMGSRLLETYELQAGQASRRNYPGENNGPLHVVSSAEPILSSIRLLYKNKSYAELTGLPVEQLSREFWYPVYDNASLGSEVHVSNAGIGSTIITVYAGSTKIDTFNLDAGREQRMSFIQNGGPLQVVSSAQPIVSSVRLLYATSAYNSLYEIMGLPKEQLSTQYFFPWYNNAAMSSELRFAVP